MRTRPIWRTTTSNSTHSRGGFPCGSRLFFTILTFFRSGPLDFWRGKCYNDQASKVHQNTKRSSSALLRPWTAFCVPPLGAAPHALGCRRLIAPNPMTGRSHRILQSNCLRVIRLNTNPAVGRDDRILLLVYTCCCGSCRQVFGGCAPCAWLSPTYRTESDGWKEPSDSAEQLPLRYLLKHESGRRKGRPDSAFGLHLLLRVLPSGFRGLRSLRLAVADLSHRIRWLEGAIGFC